MKMLRITLQGKTYEVGVEVLDTVAGAPAAAPATPAPVAPIAATPSTGIGPRSSRPSASLARWAAVTKRSLSRSIPTCTPPPSAASTPSPKPAGDRRHAL